MSTKRVNPYSGLKRIFHEPNRLAMLSALSGAIQGLTFSELKEDCGLTDGNLSRHLKALQKAGVIRVKKSFVGVKPRTTVFLSDRGRENFLRYLKALEEVLHRAAEISTTTEKDVSVPLTVAKPVQA